jgi:hypothetical protein
MLLSVIMYQMVHVLPDGSDAAGTPSDAPGSEIRNRDPQDPSLGDALAEI